MASNEEVPPEHLQETALGNEGEVDDLGKTDTQLEKYPLRETVMGPLAFNGLVTFSSLALLWGISIYCMTSPEAAMETLSKWYYDCIIYFTVRSFSCLQAHFPPTHHFSHPMLCSGFISWVTRL